MYQPAHGRFVEPRVEELHKLIRAYPLGTMITQSERGVDIDYVPFLLEERNSSTYLAGHLPRANPVSQQLDGRSTSIVFHGPNAYISPSWYPTKAIQGKAVPTWNYAVVHAYGTVRLVQEKAWLRNHLESLTAEHENGKSHHPWKLSDAPEDYVDKLLASIVGFEVTVEKLEGKFKLGQNRPREDQESVLRELDTIQPALGRLTRSYLEK